MANSPRVNNAIKKQAREYQEAHPGTHYTAAREAVLSAPKEPAWNPSPLDRIIGQPEAKKQLKRLLASRLADEARHKWAKDNNTPIKPRKTPPVRLFLSGPPGVGKTHAAHVVHELTSKSGAPFHETCASHLIGNTIGMSALLTRQVLKDAGNGTLLIDGIEAFNHNESFRSEVLDVFNAEIPRKPELSVIITGYRADYDRATWHAAREFFGMFTTIVSFSTITADDAVEFARKLVRESSRHVDEAVLEEIRAVVEEMHNTRSADGVRLLDRAGSYRFVRNLFENAEYGADLRLMDKYNGDYTNVNSDELFCVTVDDVRDASNIIKDSIR